MSTFTWDLLEGLAEKDEDAILSLGFSRTVLPGTVIFGLGDDATDLFLVREGAVKLTLPLTVGGKTSSALVEERFPGQLLGWSALVPPHRYTMEASASTETELLTLPRTDLMDFFHAAPPVGFAVFRNLAEVVGQRLQISQTMWIREMQRVLSSRNR